MPSVEMRRSTRVFVPKTMSTTTKDTELVRVLRSGRRLWVESSEVKHTAKNGDTSQWYPLLDDSSNNKNKNSWQSDVGLKIDSPMEVDDDHHHHEAKQKQNEKEKQQKNQNQKQLPQPQHPELVLGERIVKNVYSRKRKKCYASGGSGDKKFFGLHFVRRQKRRKCVVVGNHDHGRNDHSNNNDNSRALSILVQSCCCDRFSCFLGSLLKHMTRKEVGLVELLGFLRSSPICSVLESFGISYLGVGSCIKSKSFCRVFGAKQLIPLFTVDFSALPMCFLRLHATLLFSSVRISCLCWIDFHKNTENSDIDDGDDDDDDDGDDEQIPVINDLSDQTLSRVAVTAEKEDSKVVVKAMSPSAVGKLASRNAQYRLGVTTRSRSKRRRRSLRNRRARNPSLFVLQKAAGPPASDQRARKRKVSSLHLGSNQELRRSARKLAVHETSVPKPSSSPLSLNVAVDSQCCCANILVVESDKCYRVEGAEIMLDVSDSNEWVLAIKKGETTKYCLKVQRDMRPCTTNRYTHDVIWASENGWKLEFPERKYWSVFKELYKVCGERNVVPASPVVKHIPVPGACEVADSLVSSCGPFERPDSYIKMAGDELSRALSSRTAIYDMDSEDEEWLRKFNSECDVADTVSEETFELMIDAFEKASFCTSEDCSDEIAAANLCMDLASSLVADEVHGYWMKKRKQKLGPLSRVFQMNQPKKAQVIHKPVLRKKRSLKRATMQQPTQRGRGKDSSVLQAIAAEQSAAEEQQSMLTLEEAKASASRSTEVAIMKRQRAQFLMENADLAMYRATMALRIADAAQFADSQQAAAHFLDD